jgi:TldD protein
MAVVLDPSTTGTFAHESFGHGTEADQILRDRSYLKPLLGETLAPEILTLVDDGSVPDAWGTVYFDDEGFPTRRTTIIDRGRFVEVLHDRETAAALGRKPTANARRADYLSRTFVRMTNTMIAPGDMTTEELVQEARSGVLLESCTSGIEDPLGGQMQIKVKRGRRIESGRLTDTVTSMTLSGRVLDTLRSVRGVGRREEFAFEPGYCGKGHTDLLPVSTGGPYLLTEAVVGPG